MRPERSFAEPWSNDELEELERSTLMPGCQSPITQSPTRHALHQTTRHLWGVEDAHCLPIRAPIRPRSPPGSPHIIRIDPRQQPPPREEEKKVAT